MLLYTLFGIFLLCLLYHHHTRNALHGKVIKENGCKPSAKYPHRDPLFGLDMLLDIISAVRSKNYLNRLRQLYKENGNTYSSHSTFSLRIHTIEPENLKAVLSTNFRDYVLNPERKEAFRPFLGQGALTTDGTQWEHSRALLRPSFSRSQVGDLAMFDKHVTNLIRCIPCDGSTIDLASLFFRLTADMITDYMFGESINSLVKSESFPDHFFVKAFHDAQVGCAERWYRGKFANFLPHTKFYRSVKKIHNFIDQHIERALGHHTPSSIKETRIKTLDEKDERYVLLHELGKITDDRQLLRGELLTIFIAGRDTTAGLLTDLFFILARKPDVWRQLRTEITSELKGEKPTFDQLNRMVYLRYCLNEGK